MPVTGQNLIDGASDIADFVNNPHVDTTTWIRWANRAQEKLWRRLVPAVKRFYQTSSDFSLTSTTAGASTAIPAAARLILGVTKEPDNQAMRRTIRPMTFGERDDQEVLRYDIRGGTLRIEPFQAAAGSYRLYYVQGPTALADQNASLDTVLEPYVEYIETYMAAKALDKEESDSRDLYRQLAEIWDEIEVIATVRDQGAGEEIVDVDANGPGWWLR